jgi:hypothetical protein
MGEEEQPNRVLWLLSVFSNLCMVVHCRVKVDFSKVFVRLNFVETLLQGFKFLNVRVWVSVLTTWRNVYQTPPPFASLPPKETAAMTFPAEGVALNFFWREVVDDTVLLTVFLSAVQRYGFVFHLQWRSLANPSSPAS